MQRCLQLAQKGIGSVAPNPMVGAVLVYHDKVMGEGYHEQHGGPHAEVHCIYDALHKAPELVSRAVLYVSLEPCAHHGKTPPCTDLIIHHKIPKVVIGCRDVFKDVNGKGIAQLKAAGIKVIEDVLRPQAILLNKRFFTFHTRNRPYIVLKWAQTADGLLAKNNRQRLLISNGHTKRLVHKWRSEESSIAVGVTTLLADDPLLDNRYWYGHSPIKIVIDPDLKSDINMRLFRHGAKVLIVNCRRQSEEGNLTYLKVDRKSLLHSLMSKLYALNVQSIFVEGGGYTLKSFIDAGLWDEARVITNTQLMGGQGLDAPKLSGARHIGEQNILNDRIDYYQNAATGLL